MKLKELEEGQKEVLRILRKTTTTHEGNPQVDTDILDQPINSVEDFDELEAKSREKDFSRNLVSTCLNFLQFSRHLWCKLFGCCQYIVVMWFFNQSFFTLNTISTVMLMLM